MGGTRGLAMVCAGALWGSPVHLIRAAPPQPASEHDQVDVRATQPASSDASEPATEVQEGEPSGRPVVHLDVTRRRRHPVELRRRVPATRDGLFAPASEAYDVVCLAPCDVEVDGRGGELFFVGGRNMAPSSTFSLFEHRGRVDLRVRPGNRVLLVSGWVFAALGVLATVGGGVTMTLADDDMDMLDAGAIALGTGLAAVVAGGIMVWQGRTQLRLRAVPDRVP